MSFYERVREIVREELARNAGVALGRGAYATGELREIAELPDEALAAAFRDVAARDYSKCWASLFRAHVIEKARSLGVAASENTSPKDVT